MRLPTSSLAISFATLCLGLVTAMAGGIPEPGLIMYGAATNTNGGTPLIAGVVTWQISGGYPSESVTLNSTIANVNGQYFYIVRVPFETRSVSGVTLTKTPGTLGLNTAATMYMRSATVDGTNAAILPANLDTFSFGARDRGLVERVNLMVNLPGITFQDWLALYPGLPLNQRGQNDDPDGDGMSNFAEYRAGTDPTRADSTFEFIDIRPNPAGGIDIRWSSVNLKTYSVERSDDLSTGFAILQSSIAATPGTNILHDITATGTGPYFYRLTVE